MVNIVTRTLKRTLAWRHLQKKILLKAADLNRDGIEYVAQTLRSEPTIDWDRYAARTGCREIGFDPAFHYVLTGEQEGFSSDEFDAAFYAARYDDVSTSKTNRLLHYVTKGAREGRYRTPAEFDCPISPVQADPQRPIIFIIDHQASRSGAPILGWNIIKALRARYFVVSLVLAGGDLMEAFGAVADVALSCPMLDQDRKPFLVKVFAAYRPIFAVVNSLGCYPIASDLIARRVPLVLLVQEFAGVYGTRNDGIRALYAGASAIICATEVILQNSIEFYPFVQRERCFLQPQGRCEIPAITTAELRRGSALARGEDLAAIVRPAGKPDGFIVVGLGSVDIRKAVDIFIATATSVIQERPDLDIYFVWIGHRAPRSDQDPYPMYIEEQLARSDTKGRLLMLPPTADLAIVYKQVDVLFLCSRLDPMPNVCIDAAMAETAVVCFEKATGFAELMKPHDDLRELVAPYLDVTAAGRIIQRLADEPDTKAALGRSLHRMAEASFDMTAYVTLIERLGLAATEPQAAEKRRH